MDQDDGIYAQIEESILIDVSSEVTVPKDDQKMRVVVRMVRYICLIDQ